jgi:hypothetical protein
MATTKCRKSPITCRWQLAPQTLTTFCAGSQARTTWRRRACGDIETKPGQTWRRRACRDAEAVAPCPCVQPKQVALAGAGALRRARRCQPTRFVTWSTTNA